MLAKLRKNDILMRIDHLMHCTMLDYTPQDLEIKIKLLTFGLYFNFKVLGSVII